MSNPLMTTVVEPLRDGLLSFGTLGMLARIVLKILAIAVPVMAGPRILAAMNLVWPRKYKLKAQIVAEHGRDGFLAAWLTTRDVGWAVDLLPNFPTLIPQTEKESQP